MHEYDTIFQWKMTSTEAEVLNLAVCYEREYRKLFTEIADGQDIRRNSLPKKSDPRKSNLFRHCWKMRRETRGLLESHEYKLYILGNLTILKLQKAHVEPNGICGDKAWIRYKVWKRHYDQKVSDIAATAPPPSISTTNPKIIYQIDKTKKFLFERCEGQPTFEKIKSFVDNGIFKLWVATGKVSQFYVVLSSFMAKACNVDKFSEQCSFSFKLLCEKCTPEIKEYFCHEYKHEAF